MNITTFAYLYKEICINQLEAPTQGMCGFQVQTVTYSQGVKGEQFLPTPQICKLQGWNLK